MSWIGGAGWLKRLKAGLSLTSTRFEDGIGEIFSRGRLDEAALSELEDLLILGDIGTATAEELTSLLAKKKFGRNVSEEEIRSDLAHEISTILSPIAETLNIDRNSKPHIILVAGVNGTGKTTTVGKLAAQFSSENMKVMMAAADTFRAAAIDQLKIWGERTHSEVIAREDIGGDPAGVAYDAVVRAQQNQTDVLLIDTAGRLQNKANLMAELQKIDRVITKIAKTVRYTRLLVLDATTGQNAHSQVEIFSKAIQIDGLIVTKLDGTAKGGVLVALAKRFNLPVFALGVGEGIDDLRPFEADVFAAALMNITK